MTKETHSKGGYIFALIFLPFVYNNYLLEYNIYYKIILLFVYIYFSFFGSLLPDIDMKNSYISKRFPIIYKFFGKKFKHRGFTHSLIFISLLSFLGNLLIIYTDNNIVFLCLVYGFIIGCISHIVLDLLTKEGVELLYPIDINFSVLSIKTSSKLEKNICKFLNLLVIFLLGCRFYLLF